MAIRIVDRNQTRSIGYDQIRYYVGRVSDINYSAFRGYVSDHKLAGAVVDVGDEVYHIEPARKYIHGVEDDTLVVYPGSQDLAQPCGLHSEGPCFSEMARGIRGPRLKRNSQDFPAKLSAHTSFSYAGPNHFNRICGLNVVADLTFFAQMQQSEYNAVHEITFFLEEVNKVFKSTDFNGDGDADGLQLQIQEITLFPTSSSERSDGIVHCFLRQEKMSAQEVLEAFSIYMGSMVRQRCLAVLFTARDFTPKSTLGLSYLADSNYYGPGGGICESVSRVQGSKQLSALNTVMVTTVNGGMVLPRSLTSAVLAHLIGHSFGAPNDEEQCQATASKGGTYLMFPFIGLPTMKNNLRFSPCSLDRILPVLRNKGWCLEQTSEYGFCGDAIVQDSEECDCGMNEEECFFLDHCCTPADAGSLSCHVRRKMNFTCSPLTSACCSAVTCAPVKEKRYCAPLVAACVEHTTCDGVSPKCPTLSLKPDGEPCAGGAGSCHSGYCNSSLCRDMGYLDCDCEFPEANQCKICCREDLEDSDCSVLEPEYEERRLPGSPCMNNTGYCTFEGVCQVMTDERRVDWEVSRRKKSPLSPFSMFLLEHFLHIILAIVILVLLFLIIRGLVLLCRMSNVTYQFTQAVKVGLRRIWAYPRQEHYPNLILVNAARLLAFFPGVPIEEALEIAKQHDNESSMIKHLLGRGYPIRTAFFSREILTEYEKAPPRI